MLKKKNFNNKISKLLLSITKRIESFFNFLSFITNRKNFNLWKKSLDQKIYIVLAAIFIGVITYFFLPAFYNDDKIKKQLKNQILQKYNFEVKLDEIPNYGLFPKPHYLLKDAKIYYDNKILSNSKNIKVFISSKNNFEFNKIKLNNIVFTETDFKINRKNFNFFISLLNNKRTNLNLNFIKSKLFYLDENDKVIFFADLKKLNYRYQESSLNEMDTKLKIFNLPINLEINHDIINKNIFSKIKFSSLKLKFENNSTYNDDELEGEVDLNYINKDQTVRYKLKNKNLIFNTSDKKLSGEINIKPFFLVSNLNLQNIKVKDIFKDNSILVNLLKSEILNNKNLNGKISVILDNPINLKYISRINFNIQFEQGLIFISNLNFIFKNSAIFNFNDVSLIMDENKLKLIGDVIVDFKDIQNVYSHFQITRNYRKNIEKITSNFVFNIDEEFFEFSELKISGVDIQISDQYLNKFNSEKKDIFNKVILRNTVRDFFKTISLD